MWFTRLLVVCLLSACGGDPSIAGHGTAQSAPAAMAWRGWEEAAFAEAARERRLILVSVQASWCHWCHVMNDTTYTDPRVVALLRERFVAIRVDSDARPDLAERYARWGWPATIVLTPDAHPVTELRGHQPARRFENLLAQLVVELDSGQPMAHRGAAPTARDPAVADLSGARAHALAQLDGLYDESAGGWGQRQKYPYAAPVEHALFRARVYGEEDRLADAIATLEGHAQLIDPVWGGVYQYSLRGDWVHPHYEKIAAVQAGAIFSFAQGHRATGDPQLLSNARRVYDYVIAQLRDPEGGFYTSQNADFGVSGVEGAMPGVEFYALDDARRRALGAPRVDRGIYANLNGQMIAAFVALYEATGDAEVLGHAIAAADRLLVTHRDADSFTHGPRAIEASSIRHLGDQVEMARALLALYEATGDARYLAETERSVRFIQRELMDEGGGGFFAHTEDPGAVGVFAERRKPLAENGVVARTLLRLSRLTSDRALRDDAAAALRAVSDPSYVREHGRKIGDYLLALEELEAGYAILSVVGPDVAATRALHEAALRYPHPLRIVELAQPGRSRYPYPGEPAIYLCTEDACSMPISEPSALAQLADAFIGG
jgi:hypothetical protein